MRSEKGHGLVLTLVVLVVMMTALGVLASSMWMSMREVQREVRTVSLVALVDAAMAETLARLVEDDHFAGVGEYRFGDGLISSEVRPLGPKRVEIHAQAAYGGQRRSLRAEVQLTTMGPVVVRLR